MPETDRRFASISGLLGERGGANDSTDSSTESSTDSSQSRSSRTDDARTSRARTGTAGTAASGREASASADPRAPRDGRAAGAQSAPVTPVKRPERTSGQGPSAGSRAEPTAEAAGGRAPVPGQQRGSAPGDAPQLPRLASRPGASVGERNAPSASSGGSRRVAIRLPEQLHALLVARVASEGSSQGHVVLDAIEHAYSAGLLPDLVVRSMPSTRPGALFDRTRLRGRVEPSVPVELRLRPSALEQIDRLATEYGAESRTQLIIAALAVYVVGSSASAGAVSKTSAESDESHRVEGDQPVADASVGRQLRSL